MKLNYLSVLLLAFCAPSLSWAEYTLHKGDVIEYSIITANDISGEATIDISGDITLPLLGSIRAEGKALDELRKEIQLLYTQSAYTQVLPTGQEVLRRLTPEVVRIDIARYRPVYVMGAVATPGEVNFTPGMSAIQAVISAGSVGSVVVGEESSQILLDAFILRERINQTQRTRDRLKTDLARIRGDETDLTEEEKLGWLGSRDATREVKNLSLEKTVAQFRNRLRALEQQKATSEESESLDAAELEQVEALAAKGLAQRVRLTDARRALLASAGQSLQIGSEIAEVELELRRLILNDHVARQSEESDILETIEGAEADIAILEAQYRSVFGLATAIDVQGSQPQDNGLEILIIRGNGAEAKTFEASETTPVMPGDVIKVNIRPTAGVGSGNIMASDDSSDRRAAARAPK